MKTTDKKENKDMKTFKERRFEERFAELKKFCEENNRLPIPTDPIHGFYRYNRNRQRVLELRNRYEKKPITFEELEQFCKKTGRFPSRWKSAPKVERKLNDFYGRHRKEKRFIELYEQYREVGYTFEDLEKFCIENGRFPIARTRSELETRLYNLFVRNSKVKKFVDLREKYRRSTTTFEDLEQFCEETGRFPQYGKPGKERRLISFWYSHKDEPKFAELAKKYKTTITLLTFEDLKEFCEKTGRFPTAKTNDKLYNHYGNHRKEKKYIELYEQYREIGYTFEDLEKFCIENDRLPLATNKEERTLYYALKRLVKVDKKAEELYEKYRKTKPHTIEEAREFCTKNGRLPKNIEGERVLATAIWKYRKKGVSEFIELYEQYKEVVYTFEDLEKFCIENGRFPRSNIKENEEERKLYKLFFRHKNEEKYRDLHDFYIIKARKPFDFEYLITWCYIRGRLPRTVGDDRERALYAGFHYYYYKRKDPRAIELFNKYGNKSINKEIQDFFDKRGRLPKESSLIEEERSLGERLKKDPSKALSEVKVTLAPIVMKDFEQFTVAQQYEVLSIFGIPSSFIDEACKGREKKATTETLQEVFKKHGAVLEVSKDNEKISKSITEIGRIKRFSVVMEKYHADPHSPYLINESLNNLWDTIIKESKQGSTKTYDELVSDNESTEFFNIVKTQLIDEYQKAIKYVPSSEYSGKYNPDLMQRLCIIRLRERRYYANWSKTGTGKTLQSLLSSLNIDSKITLYILPNSTVSDKAGNSKKLGAIQEFIPNSNVIIYKGGSSLMKEIREDKRNYILVNYDKLSRHHFLDGLEDLARTRKIDFICIDEVQMAKSRGDQAASNRNRALLALRRLAEDCNKNLYVLGLTATPVINNLYEIKTLCEIITGKDLGDDKLFTGNSISFAGAQTAHKYLVNYGFRYNHDYSREITENEVVIPIQGGRDLYDRINEINDKFKNLGKSRRGMAGIKELEDSQIILKLAECKRRGLIKPGVTIYTQYVGGVNEKNTIAIINEWLRQNDLESVLYTGQGRDLIEDEDTGEQVRARDEELQKFIGDPEREISGTHEYKILVASSVLRTGVDGLQQVSDTIIMLSLPWTYADYEQLKGRFIRKNSKFNKVNIYIPMISLKLTTGEWSWDKSKWEILQYKKDLADLVIYGNYCNSNILRVAQNETESSLIEKVLNKIDAPLELYSEEIHPNVNYEEIREKLEERRLPYKKPKRSCVTYIHRRYDNKHTQEIFHDMRAPERQGSMLDYKIDYLSSKRKTNGAYVDPNIETARIINDIYGGPDKKVADFGCGPADPLRKLVTNCREFFSCTMEPEEVELPDYIVRCDSTRLTMVEDKHFDIVNHTNSHWGINLEDYVHEDYRVLKDDGILIITSVCPPRRNKYNIIAKAYLESGLWEYEKEPVRFGGHTGMMRGIFRKKRV